MISKLLSKELSYKEKYRSLGLIETRDRTLTKTFYVLWVFFSLLGSSLGTSWKQAEPAFLDSWLSLGGN